MDNYFNHPIFILGLPRSGTSMIAGSLGVCGAWTGSTVAADSASNPKGFFEHVVIREHVVKKILSHLGCDPLGVRKLPPLDLPDQPPGLAEFIKSIVESDGYSHDRPWLYKDAKLTLLWPYFINAFPDATWVIVNRDVDGFISSCLRTHFMKQHSVDKSYWQNFANEYNKRLIALKESGANVLEITSPEIITGDFDSLETIVLQLGLTYKEHELRDFISPICWHGSSDIAINRDGVDKS